MSTSPANYRRRLFLGLGVLFAGTVAVFVYAIVMAPGSGSLAFEGAKVLPQVGLVAVAGAIISYLAFEHQQAYLRSEARLAVLRGTLTTATESYNVLKRSRRTLRACGSFDKNGERHVRVDQYDAEMAKVIDAELSFERLAEDVASATILFADPMTSFNALKTIEQKLHEVIAEYETQRPQICNSDSCSLVQLPRFREFIARRDHETSTHALGFGVVTEAIRTLRRAVRHDLRRSAGRSPTGATREVGDEDLEGRYLRGRGAGRTELAMRQSAEDGTEGARSVRRSARAATEAEPASGDRGRHP